MTKDYNAKIIGNEEENNYQQKDSFFIILLWQIYFKKIVCVNILIGEM